MITSHYYFLLGCVPSIESGQHIQEEANTGGILSVFKSDTLDDQR